LLAKRGRGIPFFGIRLSFETLHTSKIQCCGAGAESGGANIELPPRADAEITNCGFSFGSFLAIKDAKKFYRKKITVAKEALVNNYNFNPIWIQHTSIHVKKSTGTQVKKGNCQGIFGAGVGAERNHFGTATLVQCIKKLQFCFELRYACREMLLIRGCLASHF
jgi:hypothetical protein